MNEHSLSHSLFDFHTNKYTNVNAFKKTTKWKKTQDGILFSGTTVQRIQEILYSQAGPSKTSLHVILRVVQINELGSLYSGWQNLLKEINICTPDSRPTAPYPYKISSKSVENSNFGDYLKAQ